MSTSPGKVYPVLAFCGYGRAGKDTCAEWLRDNTPLAYKGGCSWTGSVYMARRLSDGAGRLITPEEAYATRHASPDTRWKWYTWLNEYRAADPALLIKDCLAHSDVICGVRDREELLSARDQGLLDLLIWVDRTVPHDPTVTYTRNDCDLILENFGTKEELLFKLRRLALALRIL